MVGTFVDLHNHIRADVDVGDFLEITDSVITGLTDFATARRHTLTYDSHYRIDQVHTAGIIVPYTPNNVTIGALMENIKLGEFERVEKYVSHLSFLCGHFL